jgi:hypothetical protein
MSGNEELDFSEPNSSQYNKDSAKENQVTNNDQRSEKDAEANPEPGLEPLEIVDLNHNKRRVVGWLTRHPQSTIQELGDALNIPQTELASLLDHLLEEKRIIRSVRKDDVVFSAPLQGKVSRRLKGFPEDLWKKAGLDE